MSNEQCAPCAEGDHSNCLWVAGACPECGPTGCLQLTVREGSMTAYGPGNPPPEFDPPRADLWPGVISLDQVVGYQVGGKMHAPGEVTIALSLPAEPRIHSQEEFLTALDVLLDHTLHADECYIDDAQTECVCVIGKVRAVLPPCGATYRPKHPQRGDRIATCLRNAHPASPDRHVF